MNSKELGIITGLFAGIQTALVHMGTVLELKGIVTKKELAMSFRSTAQMTDGAVVNRKLIQMVLNQIAEGLEKSDHDPIKPLLRVVRNNGESPPECD